MWDCGGGSHKFVHPDFVARLNLKTLGPTIKTRQRGRMILTTASRRERLPLKEARLTVDIEGYRCKGWFVS